jgi:hypothetical protein
MKSITTFLMLVIFLTSNSLFAQTTVALSGGASFGNVRVKIGDVSASPKLKVGITAGLSINAPLSSNFNFQPALNFVQKGYEIKDETDKETVNINYVEVPLNFVYSVKRNDGFFIGAGPSIAYGISGKDKFSGDEEKIKFGSGEDEIKPFDFGANAIAGYKFKGGFMISGNYTFGLSKINNSSDIPDDNGTIKNRCFAVKIGYAFGKPKHK